MLRPQDNDLNRTVRLSENDRLSFLHQVKKDAFFLRDCNIMDYSLLLGVHHTSHQVPLMSPLPHAQQQLQQQQQQQLLQQQMQQQRDSLMMSPRSGYGGAAGADGLELNPASVRLSSIAPSLGGSRADFSNSDSFQHTGGVTRVGTSMHLSPDGHGAAGGSVSQTGSSSSREALLLQERTKFRKDDGGVQASIIEGPGIYFFGLIDILQEYNTNKKMEQSGHRAQKKKPSKQMLQRTDSGTVESVIVPRRGSELCPSLSVVLLVSLVCAAWPRCICVARMVWAFQPSLPSPTPIVS